MNISQKQQLEKACYIISVDSAAGRCTVLEAQQMALQSESERLKAEVASLEQQLLDRVNGQILIVALLNSGQAVDAEARLFYSLSPILLVIGSS